MPNLFDNLPTNLPEELVHVLAQSNQVRIERIVSNGQGSPKGFWYDQEEAEWVVVLKGEAGLQFEGEEKPHHMKSGDHLLIPAHTKHRVQWTSATEPTLWLAVFFKEG